MSQSKKLKKGPKQRTSVVVTNPAPGCFDVTCATCGEPISVGNEYGMFCKNMCGLEESKRAKVKMEKLMGGLFKLFGIDEDG